MKKPLTVCLSALMVLSMTSCKEPDTYVNTFQNYVDALNNTYESKNLMMEEDYKEISSNGTISNVNHSEISIFDHGYDEKLIQESETIYFGMRFLDSGCLYYEGNVLDDLSFELLAYSDVGVDYYHFEDWDEFKKSHIENKKDAEEKCWDYFMNSIFNYRFLKQETYYNAFTYEKYGIYSKRNSNEYCFSKLGIENGYVTSFYGEYEYISDDFIGIITNSLSMHDFGSAVPKEITMPDEIFNVIDMKSEENE